MTLGDGIRRNVATVSQEERNRLRDAYIELNRRFYPGNRNEQPIAGGVSYWFKQDEMHQASHVHNQPDFLTWHRELCNRFEALLREVDPQLSLHYWDWTQDPRTLNLFTPDFMGYGGPTDQSIGEPWLSARYYVPGASPAREDTGNPADSPRDVFRHVSGSPASTTDDNRILNAPDFNGMNNAMIPVHDNMHGFVAMGGRHKSFEDPFVFLLHSNVDRLFAMWQLQSGQEWRLDPNQVYGSLSTHPFIDANLQPWAGNMGGNPRSALPARPWAPPENEHLLPENQKNSRHPSVVKPPVYDTSPIQVSLLTGNWLKKHSGYLFQSNFGRVGNFELVVPRADDGFNFYWRNNDDPELDWSQPIPIRMDASRIDSISLIQSNFGRPGNLEVVARVGDRLAFFWRDSGPEFNWSGPFFFG
jgi:hypothetical protein